MGKNRKAIFNFFRAHSCLQRALIERLNLWPARPRDAGRLASSCSANLAVTFCVPSHAAALPAHVSDQSKVGVKKIFLPPIFLQAHVAVAHIDLISWLLQKKEHIALKSFSGFVSTK